MYDGRRKTNRCLTSYRATKTHCSEKGNYWNFTLFWGIRVRESPGFFFYVNYMSSTLCSWIACAIEWKAFLRLWIIPNLFR